MGFFGAIKKQIQAKKGDMGKAMSSGGGNASALGKGIGGLLAKKKKKSLVSTPSSSVMKKTGIL